jgi:hypothetical protein
MGDKGQMERKKEEKYKKITPKLQPMSGLSNEKAGFL